MRTISLIHILALLSISVAPAAHAQDDVALVEGHVFSKFTGVPLRGAVVQAFEVVAFPLPPLIPVASVVTGIRGGSGKAVDHIETTFCESKDGSLPHIDHREQRE